MSTESALQLSAVDLAHEAIDMAIARMLVNAPPPSLAGRRGPKRKAPRLVERGSVLYIRDGDHEESTFLQRTQRAEAAARLHYYILRKTGFEAGLVNPRKMPVIDAIDNFRRARRPGPDTPNRRDLAWKTELTRLATLTAFFGDDTFEDLTSDRIKSFTEWRCSLPDARYRPDVTGARTTGGVTSSSDLSILRQAIDLLAEEKDMSWKPRIHVPRKNNARKRHLKRAELARMLWAVRGRIWDRVKGGWKTETVIDETGRSVERRVIRPEETRQKRRILARFIALGYYTGTRHSATLALRWIGSSDQGCIDVEGRIIHRRGFGTDPSEGKPQHSSAISPKICGMMRRWRNDDMDRGIEHVIHQPDGSSYQWRVRFGWDAMVADAGLGKDVLAHVLRHTAATHLRVMGVGVMAMADLLGMNPQTAMTHYAHWTIEGQDQAADALAYGKGLKGLVVMEGVLPPQAQALEPVDDRQLELPFDIPPSVAPLSKPMPKGPPLAIPTGPFQPVAPIVPPSPKIHPTHLRRVERRTRAKLGVAARARVGYAPAPRAGTLPN